MKSLMMILLITCSACGSFPQYEVVERCTTSFDFNYGDDLHRKIFFSTIRRYEKEENRKQFLKEVTQFFGKCRCVGKYDLNYPKALEGGKNKPLSYCNDFIGFHFNTWAKEITPRTKLRRRWVKDNCSKKKNRITCRVPKNINKYSDLMKKEVAKASLLQY